MKYIIQFFAAICLFMFSVQSVSAQKDYFKDLPAECSPQKVGTILSQRFIPSKHMLHGGK